VKRGKNDAADAEAICEAMSRPSMRFVAVRTAENQSGLMLHGARDLLIKQRTMLANAIRGHAAELGITAAKGVGRIPELLERIRAANVPELAREIFARLAEQLEAADTQVRVLEARLKAWHRTNELSQRLATIPGVGPIGATALAMTVPDPGAFRSARHFAAWIGLTPKDHSTAGRQRLGGITRAGDETLRRLLVCGAMAVIQRAKPGRASPWLLALLARKPQEARRRGARQQDRPHRVGDDDATGAIPTRDGRIAVARRRKACKRTTRWRSVDPRIGTTRRDPGRTTTSRLCLGPGPRIPSGPAVI
jgi:transposase